MVAPLQPQAGPQTMFAKTSAMESLLGGAAGGGKTWSLLAEAARYIHVPTYHALLLRRTTPELWQAGGIIDTSREIYGGWAKFTQSRMRWQFPSGASVSFGHMERESDRFKYQSSQLGFVGFDQVEHFTERQYTYMDSRVRSAGVDPRTGLAVPKRLVSAANPPDDEQPGAEWIMERFAPWLDDTYPNPAESGEIRWFRRNTETGKDEEVPAGTKFAVSRTFIFASVYDNKILLAADPEYLARLQNLPEPYRSMYLHGVWLAGKSDLRRVIPMEWVRAALKRWEPGGGMGHDLSVVACDVARGVNQTVVGKRFGPWIEELEYYQTQSTMSAVKYVEEAKGEGTPAIVDVIGVGAGVVDRLKEKGVSGIVPFNGARTSDRLDSTGHFGFSNLRAEAHWMAREMLDPEGDWKIALPPDKELLADLTCPRYRYLKTGIQIEPKKQIEKRLGRSPDAGDTVIMLLWAGSYVPPQTAAADNEWAEERKKKMRGSSWQ